MSKFELEVYFDGYDQLAISKEKYTKEQAIEKAKIELALDKKDRERRPYIAIGSAFTRHRAGRNEDDECCVGWWLEYQDHGRNCPVWCFHNAKSIDEHFHEGYEYIFINPEEISNDYECSNCQREDAPCDRCVRNEENTDKEDPDLEDLYYHEEVSNE